MKVTVLTTILLVAATGAMAAPPAEAPVPVEQAAAAPSAETTAEADAAAEQKEKKICRTERATGSLTRRNRICMTEAQWREVNADTRRGLDDMTRDRVGGGTTSNN